MSDKETNLKEKLRQALASTIRVISDDLEIKQKNKDNKSSNKFDFFELDNLNNKIQSIEGVSRTETFISLEQQIDRQISIT